MSRRPLVALAGNPNTGKTTLFNRLTGARAKVGNYPGVTVERRTGLLGRGDEVVAELVDVPGTYSLVARAADEQIALEALLGLGGVARPDLVVFCVDASVLVRSLYLVLQAQELGLPILVALTMVDEAGASAPDAGALAEVLGCAVVPVDGRRGVGVDALERAIVAALASPPAPTPRWRWRPGVDLAPAIARIRAALPKDWPVSDGVALWALMSVDRDDELLGIPSELRRAVVGELGDDEAIGARFDDEAIGARYAWLDREIGRLRRGKVDRRLTERVDRVLLHRGFGFLIFLGLMFVVFQSLFSWSAPAIELIEAGFGWADGAVRRILPPGVLADFVARGLIAGVGSVLVFLPQILLLFFFIGLMEDSGYMARVAYLMDRIMRSMNLHGRAFVPMLSGFACAVPAILATRTMERQRDRLLTMMVVPLMTCSARLPIYTLVIAALYPAGRTQGLMMVGMYLFSTVTALAAAWVLSRTVKPLKARRLPFVIELPPYRVPRIQDVGRMMAERTGYFVREAGTVILGCTIVLWALLSFPRAQAPAAPTMLHPAPAAAADAPAAEAPADDGAGAGEAADPAEVAAHEAEGAQLRQSYGGRLGHAIEPLIRPLGFDWKIGVGIIGAFAAREVFISTMGIVYSEGEDVDESSPTLRDRIRREAHADGRPVYTPLVGLSLMIFFALACQCMSTLAVVKRETGGYRWPLFLFAYMTALAWVASFAVYQGGRLLGFG